MRWNTKKGWPRVRSRDLNYVSNVPGIQSRVAASLPTEISMPTLRRRIRCVGFRAGRCWRPADTTAVSLATVAHVTKRIVAW